MLDNGYNKVSANKGIVFTYFCIAALCSITLPAAANSDSLNNGKQTKSVDETAHRILEGQLLSFIEDSVMQAKQGNENDVRIQIRQIDNRIRIPFCSSPYEFDNSNSPGQQSSMSVKVTCSDNNWYLFMHANVAVIQQVVVTNDNLSPGSLLSARNLKVVEMDKNRLRGSTFSRIEDVVGARIKRRMRSGNVIDGHMLCFVCKGDRVTIAAVSAGLSITVYGVAQQDGILGDTIQVRNISSDKLIFAKIASTSQVEINI